MTVSQWADEYRILSPEAASEPGRWRTSRNEPLRGIMDAINDPTVEEVVCIKGTQVGYTEGVVNNTIGYCIDVDPCPILLVLPTDKVVDEISKNRLTPMLRDTPRLAGKVKAPRSRDSSNTIAGKAFPGGRLAMVGANSPADLASRPIRIVIADEVDKFPVSAGVEGDPMVLAAKRQETFWNRKTIKGSSPTIKGASAIEREYKRSDMRECWVACPHCREKQTLKWANVRWDKHKGPDGKNVHKPETAAYQCEHCGVLWDDSERYLALSKVKIDDWRPTAPFRGIAGFKLSQLYSSYVKLERVVAEFLTAYGKLPGTYPDPQLQKVWTNTVLAETWEEQGESVDQNALAARAEPYGPFDLPDQVAFATASIDTQGNRLEVHIIGWGAADESWPFLYRIVIGDPAQSQVWEEADELLKQVYRTRSGRPVRVMATCVDTGGHHAAQVYAFCKRRRSRRIYPVKGRNGPNPIFPKRSSRAKNNEHVWLVGSDTAKDAIYGRLRIPPRSKPEDQGLPNPGFIHFPLPAEDVETAEFNADYYAQLTSERVETRFREGKPYRVWVNPPGKRNEVLDTFAYALAARMSLPIRIRQAAVLPAPAEPDDAPAPAPLAEAPDNHIAKKIAPHVARALGKLPPGIKPNRGAAIARMFRGR